MAEENPNPNRMVRKGHMVGELRDIIEDAAELMKVEEELCQKFGTARKSWCTEEIKSRKSSKEQCWFCHIFSNTMR